MFSSWLSISFISFQVDVVDVKGKNMKDRTSHHIIFWTYPFNKYQTSYTLIWLSHLRIFSLLFTPRSALSRFTPLLLMIFAWRHHVYCANVYWAGAGSWDCLGAWDYQNITQLVNQTGYCSRKHFMLNMHPPVPCRHVVTSNNLISALIDPRLIFRGLLHNEACSQRTQRKDRGNFTVYTISTIKNFLAVGIFIN